MLPIHFLILLILEFIAIALVESRSVVFDPNPLASYNIENSNNNCNTFLSSITQDNKYAFVAAAQCGLYVISIENKMNPQLVSRIPGKSIFSSSYLNGILFVSDQQEGLSVYDMADPTKPVLLSKWQLTVSIQYTVVTSDFQYAFALGHGIVYSLSIKDIKNPVTLDYTGVLSPESYRLKFSKDETHLCVANHIQGFQIYDVRNKNKIQMRVNQNPVFVIIDCTFTPDQTSVYAVDTYNGLFYANVEAVFKAPQGSTQIYTLQFISIYTTPQIQCSISTTSDGLFLVLGLRSIGLILFEIKNSNYLQPVFVQKLNGNYLSNDIIFSYNDDEKYAFVTNGMAILIFMQAQINTNKDFPNIFNTFQSSLTTLTTDQFPWQIHCLRKTPSIIQTNNAFGAMIFDISNPYYPTKIQTIPIRGGTFGGFDFNAEETLLFMSATQDGLLFYNITDLNTPDYIKNFTPLDPTKYKNQGIGVSLDKSGAILILANGFYGFSILNISDPLNYVEIGLFVNTEYPCGFEKCVITSDLGTVICGCREIGLFFFDFTNYNLKLVNILEVLGSEYLIISNNEQYAFVCNGFQGVLIVNIQDKYNPKIIGSQPLDGWAQSLISLYNETYLLVSQIEKGELVVVNIQNFANPYIQSKLTYPEESSQSLCLTTDSSTAMFIGSQGMRSLPIETNLIIHTQIQVKQTDTNGSTYYEDLTIGDSLLVGQTAQVFFVPLYISQNIKFSNVYYYRNFEIQTLPGWITFYQKTNSLVIQVDKAGALNTFSKDTSGENIIILDCLISLSASSFITKNINSTISSQIYTTLVNHGNLDTQGFLTSSLDPTIEFYLNFFDSNQFTMNNVGNTTQLALIQQDIKQILVFSRVSYPARFFIKSSLFFNYNNVSSSSSSNIIVSPSLQVSILLQIQSNAIFVKKNFDGVLTTFSDDLTSIKLQGQTYYVNQIVANNILVANKTANLTDIVIDVILSDSSNYDISLTIPLSNLTFIGLYQPMKVNSNNNLQKQVSKQYTDGHLQVESRFQFTFDMDSFVQSENLTISYTAYIVQNQTSLIQITSGNWIEFNSFNLGFSGQKTINSLLESYTIRLVANDGYSKIYDEFTIKFTQIPFMYAIMLMIQIIGPIIGIFGIWNYRADIFVFGMSYYYKFSGETATVGQLYKKQIVLIDDMWEATHALWRKFQSQNKNFSKELYEEYTQNQRLDIPVIVAQLYHVYLNNQKQFSQIDPREFEFHDSRLVRIVKRLCYQTILYKDKSTSQVLDFLKQLGTKSHTRKDWYKSFVTISYKFEIKDNEVVRYQPNHNFTNNQTLLSPHSINQNLLSPHHNVVEKIPSQNLILQNKMKNNYPNNNSSIDQDIKNRKQSTKNQMKTEEVIEIKDKNINISQELKDLAKHSNKNEIKIDEVDQTGNQDLKSPTYNYAQDFDSQDFRHTFSNITSANHIQLIFNGKQPQTDPISQTEKFTHLKEDNMHNFNPFPEIIVQFEDIEKEISTSKPGLEWDKTLLSEILILEASGITERCPSRLNPANGMSIHLQSNQLLRVIAFKKDREDSCCLCLKKFFKANYSPIGLNENNSLPSWLNCQIIDDVVHLWGTPKRNDEPEFQIRIIDSLTFAIKSFVINIKDTDGKELKDQTKYEQLNKIRSENNIVASMRVLKQHQNSQGSQNLDSIYEQQMKALSNMPRLSKFCNEIANHQSRNRSSLSNPVISSAINKLPLESEFASFQKQEITHNFNEKSEYKMEPTERQKFKKQGDIEDNIQQKVDNMVESKKSNGENDSMNQSSNFNIEEKTDNDNMYKITVTNYINNKN